MQDISEIQTLQSEDAKDDYIRSLFATLFKMGNEPMRILDYQIKIAKALIFREHKRIVITSTTRAGKSFIIALTSLILANKIPNFKIKLIAPTYKQSQIIMGYIFEHILDNPFFIANTKYSSKELSDVIGKRVSQSMINWLNNSSIEVLSAEGEGARLMGFGGDVVIVDESALTSDKVFRTRILRMLGDNTESVLVEIGNPLETNHFYEDYMNPNFYKIKITWEECVKEGRMSQSFVDEQRSMLLPAEFKRLYDAEFVLTQDDSLFSFEKIQEAMAKEFTLEKPDILFGVDLARFGADWNVVTIIEAGKTQYILKEFIRWRETDGMTTAGRIKTIIDQYKPKYVRVDESGLGGPIIDRLRELRVNIEPINFGATPLDTKRFLNTKAEAYSNLRQILEDGRIRLMKDAKLVDQMLKIRFKFSSEAKLKIDDDDIEKSQDELDSLVIGLYSAHTPLVFMGLDTNMNKAKPVTGTAIGRPFL